MTDLDYMDMDIDLVENDNIFFENDKLISKKESDNDLLPINQLELEEGCELPTSLRDYLNKVCIDHGITTKDQCQKILEESKYILDIYEYENIIPDIFELSEMVKEYRNK